jgi:hypothetical protein
MTMEAIAAVHPRILIGDDVDPVYPAKHLLHHFRRRPAS